MPDSLRHDLDALRAAAMLLAFSFSVGIGNPGRPFSGFQGRPIEPDRGAGVRMSYELGTNH